MLYSPFCESKKISPVKVEKVLNPPQKPTEKRNLNCGDKFDFSVSESKMPKMKQLIKFAQKVAYGKVDLFSERNSAMPKRQRLPNPPPIKTRRNLLISYCW